MYWGINVCLRGVEGLLEVLFSEERTAPEAYPRYRCSSSEWNTAVAPFPRLRCCSMLPVWGKQALKNQECCSGMGDPRPSRYPPIRQPKDPFPAARRSKPSSPRASSSGVPPCSENRDPSARLLFSFFPQRISFQRWSPSVRVRLLLRHVALSSPRDRSSPSRITSRLRFPIPSNSPTFLLPLPHSPPANLDATRPPRPVPPPPLPLGLLRRLQHQCQGNPRSRMCSTRAVSPLSRSSSPPRKPPNRSTAQPRSLRCRSSRPLRERSRPRDPR